MLTACRRRTVRLHADWRVWIRSPFGAIKALVGDANETGLFVRTVRTDAIGRIVTMQVLLDDGPLELFGVVRFVGLTAAGRGMGLELLVMPAAKRQRWLRAYGGLAHPTREQLAA